MFKFSRIHTLFAIVLLLALTACSESTTPPTDVPPTEPPVAEVPTLILASDDDPGQRLTLHVRIVDNTSSEPIANATVYLYHADETGQYRPSDPADESTAYHSGEIVTDEDGRFVVHTILPGEYDQPGNRHVHVQLISAEGYEAGGGLILFDDNVNDTVRLWAMDTGFGTIIETVEQDGVLVGDVVLGLDSAES